MIPWRRKWQPTPVFLPGESHGQRSLEGYGPWGRKEPDTAEWLTHHNTRQDNKKQTDLQACGGPSSQGRGPQTSASAAPHEESWENMGHRSLLLRAAGLEDLGRPLIIDLYKKLLVPLASQMALVVRICLQ